ncbi:MAG: hypothetical protein V3R25_06055 [Nitrosomonadaceae bacterium]
MTTSLEQAGLDLVKQNEQLIESLNNMIDGVLVWGNKGECCYCHGTDHKKGCEYMAAISLLFKIRNPTR